MVSPVGPIKRRRIHYFSGFDPRGGAYYHKLCQTELGKAQPEGSVLHVGNRVKLSRHSSCWRVQWKDAEGGLEFVETEHVFMGWDDVVRTHWQRAPGALAREFVATYVYIFRHIGAVRVWSMYRPAFKAGALPLVILLGPVLLSMLLGAWFGLWGGIAGLSTAVPLWLQAGRAGLFWLLRTYTFFARMGTGPIDPLDDRTREWVETIVLKQRQDPVDEVLFVGHSVGTLVMVNAMDALLQDDRWRHLQGEKRTCILTLGQCIPMVAMSPFATILRGALQRMVHHPRLCWWDVTARIDPLCFYKLHPLAGSPDELERPTLPVLHTARFMRMYEPRRWTAIRKNKLLAHFLYLMTPQKMANFSPADVLYGPRGLAQQIADSGTPQLTNLDRTSHMTASR